MSSSDGGAGADGFLSRRQGRRERRRRQSLQRKMLRRLVQVVAVLVVIAVVAAGAGYWYVNYTLDKAHRSNSAKHVLVRATPGAPFNVLLIGSDSRQFEKKKGQAKSFGSSSVVTGQRSDVVIIARLVPATHHVYLLSIPRDTYVNIPGHIPYVSGVNRINAAFNNGPALLIKTIEKDFHIPIEHFAEINFAGFSSMVSAVGGLRIDFPDKLRDYYSGLGIGRTGCQLISGRMALAYVRSRHLYYKTGGVWNYDGMSDWSRIRRQDVFFRALLDQVKTRVKNFDVSSLMGLLSATVRYLTLDSSFTNNELLHLALSFRGVSTADIHSEVLPTEGAVVNGADVVVPVWRYDVAMVRSFLAEGKQTPHPAVGHHSGPTSTTNPRATTTTTPSPYVVFDKQPEPWNGAPC